MNSLIERSNSRRTIDNRIRRKAIADWIAAVPTRTSLKAVRHFKVSIALVNSARKEHGVSEPHGGYRPSLRRIP